MLKKILKIFRNSAIFLVIFGVVFSNIPFYVLSGAIEGYVKTANIVDQAWHLSKKNNIVDSFVPSYRNKKIALLDKLAGNLKIKEAQAAVSYVGGTTCSRAGSTGTSLVCSLTGALTGGSASSPSQNDIVIAVVSTGSIADRAIGVTNVGYTELPELYANSTTDTNLSVSWKIMGSTPDSSVIFGSSGNAADAISAVVHVWRGIDTASPFDVTNQSITGTGTGQPNPPPITPVTSGATVIVIGASAAGTGAVYTAAGLSNFRTVASSDTYDSMTGMGSFAWSSGAYDSAQFAGGTAGGTDTWASYTLALRPNNPPTPNPMTFATPTTNFSETQIDMTATTASDPSTPINYLFTNDNTLCGANAGTGGTSSSWQAGTTYSDTGLQPNKCYGYTIQARDSLSNTGTASGISSTYTSANTPGTPTLGSPTESTLSLTNAENSNPSANPTTYFAVQVVTTSDGNWLNKWADATGNPSATAVWLTDAQLDALVLQGLQSSTLYGVKVKARNQDTDETPLSAEGQGTTSAPANALTVTTTGSQAANLNSGDSIKHIGDAATAAFQLQMSGSAVNVNSVKLTEQGGSITLSDLTNQKMYYESASTCTYNGNESNVSATPTGETVTFSFTGVPVPVSPNYLCLYYVFDLDGTNAVGGETIDIEINNPSTDVVLASGQNTDTVAKQLAVMTTVMPQITDYSNTTPIEAGLLDYAPSCTGCGARIGSSAVSLQQRIVITGFGFGSDPGLGNRDTASNKVEIVGASTTLISDNGAGNSNVNTIDPSCGGGAIWTPTCIVITTDTTVTGNADADWGTNFGGASALKVTIGGQTVPTNLNFYVFPQVSSLVTVGSNAAREYDAGDTDGVVTVNGTRFGTSSTGGWVRILGCDSSTCASPTGSVTTTAWGNTSITAQVPTVIAENTYTGSFVVQQGNGTNNKQHQYTASGFRIIPRIISNTPASGVIGDVIKISGNHFCQTGTCPISPNRSTASNNVQFGTTQAIDSDFVDKTPSCGGADTGAAWTDTDICVKVPSGIPLGSQPTQVTSTDGAINQTSNTKAFSVATTTPNNPDVGPAASKGQFKSDGATAITTGGGTNQTTVVFKMEMSGGANMTIEPQVEADPINTAFEADNISIGTSVAYSGTPVTGTVTISGLTDGSSYHWRARVRNTGTNEFSGWVVFGGNSDCSLPNPCGPVSATDFSIDASMPAILTGPIPTAQEFSATIVWTTNENATSNVDYGPTTSYGFSVPSSPDTSADITAHSVAISGLNCGSTYYYRVKTADGQGNERITADGPSFATSACVTRIMRTIEYQWKQELNPISGVGGNASGTYNTLSAYIKESDSTISSSFVIDNATLEFSGVVKGTGSGNPTANIKINSLGYPTAVSLPDTTAPNLFQMRYNIPNPNTAGNIYISPRDVSTNTVDYQFTNVDKVSALNVKLIVTYYYTPL